LYNKTRITPRRRSQSKLLRFRRQPKRLALTLMGMLRRWLLFLKV